MKLKTEQRYDPNYTVTPSNATNPTNDGLSDYKNTDYVGNIVYETVKSGSTITNRTRILVDGGYYEGGVYHYYLADHLGNNRVVVNQSGTVTQKSHYYPFGTAFADKYDNGTNQPYKYNGKELDGMHQLNLYDYSARYYESALGRFTSVDPLAEKYYSWSPYAYVMNNPLKYIDPKGMSPEDGDPEKERRKREAAAEKSIDIKQQIDLLFSDAVTAILSLFAIRERVTTPDGETYDKYTKRTYENSGPDYLGVNASGSIPIPFVWVANYELELNVGYIKNNGWVLFPTYKISNGINLSVGGGLVLGLYKDIGKPTPASMKGDGTFVNYSYGLMTYEYSQGYNSKGRVNWDYLSVGIGKSFYPKNWSIRIGKVSTELPHYFRDINLNK